MIPAVLAVLVLPAAEAAAGTGYGQLIVNPGTVTAGQTVSVLGVCPDNGQPFTGVYSTAFAGGAAAISRGSVNFTGSATISSSTAPGTYTVAAECGAGSPSVKITVAAPGSAPTTQPAAAQPSTAAGQGASTWSAPAAVPPVRMSTPAAAGGSGVAPASAMPDSNASAPASSQSPKAAASDPAVTSTGVVRVGLAGNSKPLLPTSLVESLLALVAVSGAAGFIAFQRRRKSHTHNS